MVVMPPASAAHGSSTYADTGFGFSLLLGTEYERRKHKLKQELQLDYKQHVAKKKELKSSSPPPQHQGLSLPIDDSTAAQEKLKDERNREYNLFLQKQAQNKKLRRGLPPVTTEASDAACISPPAFPLPTRNILLNHHPPPWERPASRKDAATLTEALDDGKRTNHRGRKRWQIVRRKESYSSEEEFDSDREEEFLFRRRRRQDRHTPEPECKEERRTRQHKADRAPQGTKEVEAPGGYDQNNNVLFGKSDQHAPGRMRSAARSRPPTSRDKPEWTGLMIGATEEQTAAQLRKEQYKQELLKQIAENQEKKMREKKLELRVASTGAIHPKKTDRLNHFGEDDRLYDSWKPTRTPTVKDPNPRMRDDEPAEDSEQNIPRGASHVDYTAALSQLTRTAAPGSGGVRAAQGVPPLDYFTEDYHRDFTDVLGEVAVPRVAAAPPPAPPTVTDHYRTPYDAAYYYYGARNPLDLSPPYNKNGASEGQQQCRSYHSPPVKPAPVRPSGLSEGPAQRRAAPLNVGEVLAERSKGRENMLSYQEALRQQIKEREEQRRREKEEKERYDAKVEAELMAYNPWGRSGGGAPIKDQKGNLVSNLTQMHRNNNESTRYHLSRTSGYTQSHMMRDCLTPGSSPRVTPLQEVPGVVEAGYKEELKKQIEQKRRQQEREKERLRLEEEREEKRLEEQRACIKREYEEEQRKQKQPVHRQETQPQIHELTVQQSNKERKARQQQEIKRKTPESSKEERTLLPYLQREPSPPIPTLQRKQRNPVASRPPSVGSQHSSRTDRSVSAPSCREVTAKAFQLQDGQQEVIRELSTLRTYLRNQQRQLEAELDHNNSQSSRSKGRVRLDMFQLSQRRAAEPTTRRSPTPAAARTNMQNIREFNQLKYRDTASREELRHMYPDPPTDAQSLDIQQQALLREQQRKIRLMKREEEHGFLDQELHHYQPRNKSGHLPNRDVVLPSQSAFIDVYSEEVREEQAQQRRRPSAGNRERRGAQRRRDSGEVADSMDQREHQSSQGNTINLRSKDRPHNQHHTEDNDRRREELSGDEADVLSLRSALGRRVSVDTVATEPWLRPGTSDAVKQSVCRERQKSSVDTRPWLTNRVT
ncbi:centrosome and spindle pole-associated protein 1 isoform X2 [Halichoeres trimaculatus]|uniref:centrosome and spindle pole-associated protein 1 isoform X2 n=1 Tax=Halichoeres trimaculatus TaxID=147232 RepID=UPI003D9E0FBE